MNIRHYNDSDLEAVLSAWEVATRLAHPFMMDEFIAQERINVAEMYMPNTDTWVVEVDGNVEGFIALMGNEVGAIFLQPKFHGKGAGKALMDKAQEIHGDLEVEVFKEECRANDVALIPAFSYSSPLPSSKLQVDHVRLPEETNDDTLARRSDQGHADAWLFGTDPSQPGFLANRCRRQRVA